MGRMVIVAYRPKPGMDARLAELVRAHVPSLRALGLATDRPALAMKAADGTIVEVFEWVSAQAIERAHTLPEIQQMWTQFGEACEYGTLATLPEAQQMFAHFEPLD
jgi:hypothetical protein